MKGAIVSTNGLEELLAIARRQGDSTDILHVVSGFLTFRLERGVRHG